MLIRKKFKQNTRLEGTLLTIPGICDTFFIQPNLFNYPKNSPKLLMAYDFCGTRHLFFE